MKNFYISYSKDVNKDLINFLKKKFRCIKIKDYSEKSVINLLKSKIFITKYIDLPKFSDKKFNLKLLQLTTSDYSKINKKYAKKKKIFILNNQGANSTSVAEHTIALLLTNFRNIIKQNLYLKKGIWLNLKDINIELENKKIGIIGIGKAGLKVCKLAKAFNMKVFFNEVKNKKVERYRHKFNFKTKKFIYKNCDIISLHVDLNKTTNNLIGLKELNMMKKNATLINTSRGKVVNEKELTNFLINNKNFKACIDVYQNEKRVNKKLVNLPNVVSTPHSGPSKETRQKLFKQI